MVSKANRKKYNIRSTSLGYPEFELALNKAKEQIGWKALTALIVGWCNKNQPEDAGYSISYWQKEMPLKKQMRKDGKSIKNKGL